MALHLTLDNFQDHIGADVGVSPWVEIEGEDKAALVAEWLTMAVVG